MTTESMIEKLMQLPYLAQGAEIVYDEFADGSIEDIVYDEKNNKVILGKKGFHEEENE